MPEAGVAGVRTHGGAAALRQIWQLRGVHALCCSMLDAGLPRKEDPEDQKSDVWTAPSYFDISLGGLSDDFGALRSPSAGFPTRRPAVGDSGSGWRAPATPASGLEAACMNHE